MVAPSSFNFNKAQQVMTNYKYCSEGKCRDFLRCQLFFQPTLVYPLFAYI